MLSITLTILAVLISYFIYEYINKFKKAREILNWIPHIPRKPVIGIVMEFTDSDEVLNDMTRLTNNPVKMAYMEGPTVWGILSRNYEFSEFLLSNNTILEKSFNYTLFHEWLGTGLLTSTGSKWKQRRRIITPAFHFAILDQFVQIFDKDTDILMDKLQGIAVNKATVNIYEYVTLCALDSICESTMGVRIESQNFKNQDYVHAVKDYCRIAVIRMMSSWKRVPVLFKLAEEHGSQRQNVKILHGFSTSVIEKRKREFVNEKLNEALKVDSLGRKNKLAFLDLLLNATVDGKPLTSEDIREEVDTFIFEGHDTTSSAIASALFLLANNPKHQDLVRKEQKDIYGKDRDRPTTSQDLHAMKYLDLVIKETLRLYPSVPVIGRKVTEDIEYKGHKIPKNTFLTIFIYGMHRDPDYFESPNEFIPERFLDTNFKSPYLYVPFSAGPRNCIGQKFAVLEMKCMISKIIRHFVLSPTNPPHKMIIVSEAVLKSRNGVNVQLERYDWEAAT
ncbi:cytochrome P450 4d2-like [Euwallacea fornicatus]|uniref:cytochrome P450 4d2-like n=1 Tax=Euwallacea fornicatus TaxID=995702 RepID=UPI00338E4A69